ncbi:hypothetical protein [Thermococcus sp. MV11]|nr:hypothetical protein [Thermococcus sp. MV11]
MAQMKGISRDLVVGILVGMAIGAVFSYALAVHDDTSGGSAPVR